MGLRTATFARAAKSTTYPDRQNIYRYIHVVWYFTSKICHGLFPWRVMTMWLYDNGNLDARQNNLIIFCIYMYFWSVTSSTGFSIHANVTSWHPGAGISTVKRHSTLHVWHTNTHNMHIYDNEIPNTKEMRTREHNFALNITIRDSQG